MSTVNNPLPVEEQDDVFTPTKKKPIRIYGQFDFQTNAVVFFSPIKDPVTGVTITKGYKEYFDPQVHKPEQRAWEIKLYCIPLAEQPSPNTKLCELSLTKGSIQWEKETLPSLIALNVSSASGINGKFGAYEIIESAKFYYKDGEKKHNLTWKFIAIYDSEETARAACIEHFGENAGTPSDNQPAADPADADKIAAMAFLKVIVPNACKGKKITDDWKAAVNTALAQYPMVSKHFDAESPEVAELALPVLAA